MRKRRDIEGTCRECQISGDPPPSEDAGVYRAYTIQAVQYYKNKLIAACADSYLLVDGVVPRLADEKMSASFCRCKSQ
jgi:hypothetical protein